MTEGHRSLRIMKSESDDDSVSQKGRHLLECSWVTDTVAWLASMIHAMAEAGETWFQG